MRWLHRVSRSGIVLNVQLQIRIALFPACWNCEWAYEGKVSFYQWPLRSIRAISLKDLTRGDKKTPNYTARSGSVVIRLNIIPYCTFPGLSVTLFHLIGNGPVSVSFHPGLWNCLPGYDRLIPAISLIYKNYLSNILDDVNKSSGLLLSCEKWKSNDWCTTEGAVAKRGKFLTILKNNRVCQRWKVNDLEIMQYTCNHWLWIL